MLFTLLFSDLLWSSCIVSMWHVQSWKNLLEPLCLCESIRNIWRECIETQRNEMERANEQYLTFVCSITLNILRAVKEVVVFN